MASTNPKRPGQTSRAPPKVARSETKTAANTSSSTSSSASGPPLGPRAPAPSSGGKAVSYAAAVAGGSKAPRPPASSKVEDSEIVFTPSPGPEQLSKHPSDPAQAGPHVPEPRLAGHTPVAKSSPKAPPPTAQFRGHPPKPQASRTGSHAQFPQPVNQGSENEEETHRYAGISPPEVPSERQIAPSSTLNETNNKKQRLSLDGWAPLYYAIICRHLPSELRSMVENWCGEATDAVKVIDAIIFLIIALLPSSSISVTGRLIEESKRVWGTPATVGIDKAALSRELSVLCGTRQPDGTETGLICTVIKSQSKATGSGKKVAGKKDAEKSAAPKTLICKAPGCLEGGFQTSHNPNENFAHHFIYKHVQLKSMYHCHIPGYERSFEREADLRSYLCAVNQKLGKELNDAKKATLQDQWRMESAQALAGPDAHPTPDTQDGSESMDLSSSLQMHPIPHQGYHEGTNAATSQPDTAALPPSQSLTLPRQAATSSPELLLRSPRLRAASRGATPYMRPIPASVIVSPGIQVSMAVVSQLGQHHVYQAAPNQFRSFEGRAHHARPGPSSSSRAPGANGHAPPSAPQPQQQYSSDAQTRARTMNRSSTEHMDLSASYPPPTPSAQPSAPAMQPQLTRDQLAELGQLVNDYAPFHNSHFNDGGDPSSRAHPPSHPHPHPHAHSVPFSFGNTPPFANNAWPVSTYNPAVAAYCDHNAPHMAALGGQGGHSAAYDMASLATSQRQGDFAPQPMLSVYSASNPPIPPSGPMPNAPTSQTGYPINYHDNAVYPSQYYNARPHDPSRHRGS